jgi:hypothetical protein
MRARAVPGGLSRDGVQLAGGIRLDEGAGPRAQLTEVGHEASKGNRVLESFIGPRPRGQTCGSSDMARPREGPSEGVTKQP